MVILIIYPYGPTSGSTTWIMCLHSIPSLSRYALLDYTAWNHFQWSLSKFFYWSSLQQRVEYGCPSSLHCDLVSYIIDRIILSSFISFFYPNPPPGIFFLVDFIYSYSTSFHCWSFPAYQICNPFFPLFLYFSSTLVSLKRTIWIMLLIHGVNQLHQFR